MASSSTSRPKCRSDAERTSSWNVTRADGSLIKKREGRGPQPAPSTSSPDSAKRIEQEMPWILRPSRPSRRRKRLGDLAVEEVDVVELRCVLGDAQQRDGPGGVVVDPLEVGGHDRTKRRSRLGHLPPRGLALDGEDRERRAGNEEDRG